MPPNEKKKLMDAINEALDNFQEDVHAQSKSDLAEYIRRSVDEFIRNIVTPLYSKTKKREEIDKILERL